MSERVFSSGVVNIFTSPGKGEPMEERQEVEVIAGKGIRGDRYAERTGAYSGKGRLPDSDRQITLISQQGVDEANKVLAANGDQPIPASQTRRNVVVGVPPEELLSFIGQTFQLGKITLEGVEDCAPCRRPPTLLGRPEDSTDFEVAFKDRGGLRARIINDGHLRTGDQLIFPRSDA